MKLLSVVLITAVVLISNCKEIEKDKPIQLEPSPIAVITAAPVNNTQPPQAYPQLAWNNESWDKTLIDNLKEKFNKIDQAKDLESLYPGYSKLTYEQRIKVLAELLVQLAKYESNWKNDCYYIESTMGTDPITGRQVASEGLFQLSYQDQKNYLKHFDCGFDWEKDKSYGNKDPRKTIFDPGKNISCAVKILARQVEKYGAITINTGAYWSTLKIGSSHSKIDKIKVYLKGLKI